MTRRSRWLLVGWALALLGAGTWFTVFRNEARDQATRDRLWALIQPVTLSNCTLERLGEPGDGGYLICTNLLTDVQAGYSYGIAGYDQWGCDVSRRRHVPVHQYDCFDTRQPACDGGEMVFHAECVGGTDQTLDGRLFRTAQSQIAGNGDSGKRLIVKMDVEGSEWDSLLATPDAVLAQIDQLVLEFHGVNDDHAQQLGAHADQMVPVLEKLARIFHVAHVHFNNYACRSGVAPFPADAYEVSYVNKRLGMVKGPGRIARHVLDAPNGSGPDCQVP